MGLRTAASACEPRALLVAASSRKRPCHGAQFLNGVLRRLRLRVETKHRDWILWADGTCSCVGGGEAVRRQGRKSSAATGEEREIASREEANRRGYGK
jgi:hypothetical protein